MQDRRIQDRDDDDSFCPMTSRPPHSMMTTRMTTKSKSSGAVARVRRTANAQVAARVMANRDGVAPAVEPARIARTTEKPRRRDVPTWLETIEVLVNANIENHKKVRSRRRRRTWSRRQTSQLELPVPVPPWHGCGDDESWKVLPRLAMTRRSSKRKKEPFVASSDKCHAAETV